MEEIEVPTEHLHEHMHHASHEGQAWLSWVALSSAILAAFAAAGALLSGHHANEAMLTRIEASNKWSYYQAKSVKANLLVTKGELLAAFGKPAAKGDDGKASQYEAEQEKIAHEAEALEKQSQAHLETHSALARAVTLFQVAIAVGAIAALSRRKPFFWVSLGFGALGVAAFFTGLAGH